MMNDLMGNQAQQMDLQQFTRRHFFSQCSMGLGSIALGSLLEASGYTVDQMHSRSSDEALRPTRHNILRVLRACEQS